MGGARLAVPRIARGGGSVGGVDVRGVDAMGNAFVRLRPHRPPFNEEETVLIGRRRAEYYLAFVPTVQSRREEMWHDTGREKRI